MLTPLCLPDTLLASREQSVPGQGEIVPGGSRKRPLGEEWSMSGKKMHLAAGAALALGLFVSSQTARAALLTLDDVTTPGDTITAVNGISDDASIADGLGNNPPLGESAANAIDNTTTKYLNFLDYNSGFIVTPSKGANTGGTIVRVLRLYTANDSPSRDPASFILEGAQSATGVFTPIAVSNVTLPGERNAAGQALNPNTQNFVDYAFGNTTAYKAYRLTFPTLRNGFDANSMQIGEVELLGTVVPEPAALGLLSIGALSLLARRRRA
jgi:hypothetical protein